MDLQEVLLLETFKSFDLENQHFKGPRRRQGEYASISVFDPIINIELLDGLYHIAARFNLETTILGYDSHRRCNPQCFMIGFSLLTDLQW